MSFASMRTVAARGITCHKKHKFIGSTFDGHAVESFDASIRTPWGQPKRTKESFRIDEIIG